MKIAIVDDNKEFLLIIKNVLININNQLNITCFEDGFTFLKKAMEYELVFLDITATHEGRDTMVQVVQQVASSIYMPFTVGGGLKTIEDIKRVLRAGADKVRI